MLKDAYNIFQSASTINQLSQIELIWYTKVDAKNKPVLSLTLTKEAIQQLASKSYADLPAIATKYEKYQEWKWKRM